METRVWELGIFLLLVFGRLTSSETVRVSPSAFCPAASITDSIFRFRDLCTDSNCPLDDDEPVDLIGVIEGDEVLLQRALNLLHKNSHEYVSVLFYASWCPFSRTCRPTFTLLSSLYPSIRHFAIEESAIRPSILSRYGVHGFPTIFLLNSTTRLHYHGSRTLNSLVGFYSDVTGIKPALLVQANLDKNPSNLAKLENIEQESCPFSWAISPENLLRQETYLALATAFLLLRLLHFLLPTLLTCARCAWSRHIRNVSLVSLWEHSLSYLNQAMQVFNAMKEPCRKTNLQEGALNARAWASKSLASVSIGDASSSRPSLGSESCR
ncbi:hypothetical protein HHK36_008102 [Tetracentron sinense]|uniref:Thioredoxin domain-containing protein n=1 Tax=Tetracentron sinense TaxID=13715 RepID=A0A835DMW9_TETSI|nr:hypothetical protein HHK36_008102 [Tetracentron sinense]